MTVKKRTAVVYAILAALLFGIGTPLSKLLIDYIPPAYLASFLYIGAGSGMGILLLVKKLNSSPLLEANVSKEDKPQIIAMIVLDIAAPILLMYAVASTTSSNVSLLNNFEIVATALIAFFVFHEGIGRKMWYAIILILIGCLLLSFEGVNSLHFSYGSALVLIACVCWGFENNMTKKLSGKNPIQIVAIKGIGSGFGALIIAMTIVDFQWNLLLVFSGLLLGFCSYGLSIYFYIRAQRILGAALTSAYYAAAPFIGAILSFILLHESLNWMFALALIVMLAGSCIAVSDNHNHGHIHEALTHNHRHNHGDNHHFHDHDAPCEAEHSHIHTHCLIEHAHEHLPDSQHTHLH